MDDLISRQAAIDELCDNCDHVEAVCPHYPCKQYIAIENLPSAQPYTEAEIQKMQELEQAELQKAYECGRASAQPDSCEFYDTESHFCTLHRPSAQPERKTGKWILDDEYIDCSACKREKWSRVPYESLVKRFRFCPNCGADMRGETE